MNLRLRSITDPEELLTIRDAWERLWNQTCAPTGLFSSWAYVAAYVMHRQPAGWLVLVLSDADGEPVGIFPLQRVDIAQGERSWRLLRPLGVRYASYIDYPIRAEYREHAWRALARVLPSHLQCDALLLGPLHETSADRHSVLAHLAHFHPVGIAVPTVAEIDTAQGFDSYAAGRKKATIPDARRCARRLAERGAVSVRYPSDDADIEHVVDLVRQWQQERFDDRHLFGDAAQWGPTLAAFMRAVPPAQRRVATLDVDGQIIAAQLGFALKGRHYYFLAASSPAFHRDSPSKVLLAELVQTAFREGSRFCFGGGLMPYKTDWANATASIHFVWTFFSDGARDALQQFATAANVGKFFAQESRDVGGEPATRPEDSNRMRPAESAYEQAVMSLHAGEFGEAARRTLQWLLQRPNDGNAWRLLGVARYRQGLLPQAETGMRRALACDPRDIEARINLGSLLQEREAFAQAVDIYREIDDRWQLYPRAGLALAYCLHKIGEPHSAQQELTQLLAGHPHSIEGWRLLALVRSGMHDQEGAAQAWRELLALSPDDGAARFALARASMFGGALREAIGHFRLALEHLLALPLPEPKQIASSSGIQSHEPLFWRTLHQLYAAGVHAFPCSGTLLGLVREGRVLEFDKDFDVGLPFGEMAQAEACLAANGWRQEPNPMRHVNPRSYRHIDSGVVLDLCGLLDEPDSGKIIGGFWQEGQPWPEQRVVEYPAPMTLRKTASPEGDTWALDQPERWLHALYGNWRERDPDFDTVIAAKNLRSFSPLVQCYALMRLHNHLQSGRLAKARALVSHALRHLPADPLLLAAGDKLDGAPAI
ncbi:GNAT family N-acetyltransferase [Paracidovorax citrulli]